jgi:SurA N-terminal domain
MAFKKMILGMLVAFMFVSGCGPRSGTGTGGEVVISINDYKITRAEFESEFKDSAYGAVDTPESRQNFLNALIDRKLILQYAQKEGLDKETTFLKTIEKFWEQSLLKIVLDRKMLEMASRNVAGGWEVQRAEDAKKMNDWMSELRTGARITVNEGALKNAAGPKGGR